MSTNSEDAHMPSWAQGAERTLAILDLEQQQRRKIEHGHELDVLLAPHHLEIADAWVARLDFTNHPPTAIPPWEGIERIRRGQGIYVIPLRVQDSDPHDSHVWRLISGGDAFASVSGAELRLDTDHSTARNGRYNVVVEVEDLGGVDGETDRMEIRFRLVVPNRAPVIDAQTDETIYSRETWTHTVAATDRDGDTLTYGISVTPEPETSKINFNDQTGVITWKPNKKDEGKTFSFTYSVKDGHGGTDDTIHDVTVAPKPVSAPDIRTDNPTLVARREGTRYRQTFTAVDSDTTITALRWSKVSGPGTLSGTTQRIVQGKRWASAIFTWTAPQVNDDTDYTVKLRVTATGGNPAGDSATIEFVLRSNHNEEPVLTAIGDFSVQRGKVKEVSISATDAENNAREFYEDTGPAWATVSTDTAQGADATNSKNTGKITASPSLTTPLGPTPVIVGVRESAHPTTHKDTEELSITVTRADTPPTFTKEPADYEETDKANIGKTREGHFQVDDPDLTNNDPALTVNVMTFKVKSGDATIRLQGRGQLGIYEAFVNAKIPNPGENNPIVMTVIAHGGDPANEETDSKTWNVSTADIDLSPNITPVAQRQPGTYQNTGAGPMLYFTITAAKHDGTVIPAKDITVTQNVSTFIHPLVAIDTQSPQFMTADKLQPRFKNDARLLNKWVVGLLASLSPNTNFTGMITVNFKYTDTVYGKAHTASVDLTWTFT